MSLECSASRVSVNDLARSLGPSFPNLTHRELSFLIRNNLNNIYDKTPDKSDPYDSISRAEASWFVLEAQADSRTGRVEPWRSIIMSSLQQHFFNGRTDWNIPPTQPKFPAQITRCADGDTCTAFVYEDPGCPPLQETLRFSAVDTPESFPSLKLKRVRDEVAQRLAIPERHLEVILPLIQSRIQYTGKLAGLIMQDFQTWLQIRGDYLAVSNSYIFNRENKYLGLWQGYGNYLRRVVSLHAPQELIAEYFRTRLPSLMGGEGQKYYKDFLLTYTQAFREATRGIPSTAPYLQYLHPKHILNPAHAYSKALGAQLASYWINEVIPSGYGDDWTAALIFTGAAYYYPKYRNQHGEAYGGIQKMVKENTIGLWNDVIFQLMAPSLLAEFEDWPEAPEANNIG